MLSVVVVVVVPLRIDSGTTVVRETVHLDTTPEDCWNANDAGVQVIIIRATDTWQTDWIERIVIVCIEFVEAEVEKREAMAKETNGKQE